MTIDTQKCLPCILHYGTEEKLFALIWWGEDATIKLTRANTREEAAKKFVEADDSVKDWYKEYIQDLDKADEIPSFEEFKRREGEDLLRGDECRCIAKVID